MVRCVCTSCDSVSCATALLLHVVLSYKFLFRNHREVFQFACFAGTAHAGCTFTRSHAVSLWMRAWWHLPSARTASFACRVITNTSSFKAITSDANRHRQESQILPSEPTWRQNLPPSSIDRIRASPPRGWSSPLFPSCSCSTGSISLATRSLGFASTFLRECSYVFGIMKRLLSRSSTRCIDCLRRSHVAFFRGDHRLSG